ncbi:MAG: hypothetical protein AAF915_27135 [Cyanobacteria bacterium P01_D01_bin.50]
MDILFRVSNDGPEQAQNLNDKRAEFYALVTLGKLYENTFNIVHIATHGKFSSNPKQTYIFDWDKRIQIKDWNTLQTVK